MLVSLSSGLAGAQIFPPGIGNEVDTIEIVENDYAVCGSTSDTLVTCSLKIADSQSSLNLVTHLLPLAQQINADVQSYTVMWVQAWGGKGGKGKNYSGSYTGGWGGFGGYAQTITTIDDYESIYGTTTLHYFFGAHGQDEATDWDDGKSGAGGTSTIVASVATGFAASNVLLIAGGGGGGNYGVYLHDGQEGGHGGTAIATSETATYGAGQDLSGNSGTVRGGSYSGPGKGSPVINPANFSGPGGDGFGGWGGTQYASADSPTFWLNGFPNTNQGHGVSSGNSAGSPSGGGYGGGGMNACGNDTHHDCGGPGGGSYAAGNTQVDGDAPTSLPTSQPSNAEITIVFNVAPASYTFTTPVANPYGIETSSSSAVYPTFVDINGDGTQDLFIGSATSLDYLENTGTATIPAFASPVSQDFMVADSYGRPTFVDIDNDGDFDLYLGTDAGALAYYENMGTASSPDFTFIGIGTTLGGLPLPNPASLAFGDLTGDGLLDLIISGNSGGDVYFYENQGTATQGSFATPQINPFGINPLDASGPIPALVDIHGNGVLDLFVGGPGGSTSIYQNVGTATEPQFLERVFNPYGLKNLGSDASPAFVDIDQSGSPDAFIGSGSGTIWFFANNAAFTFESSLSASSVLGAEPDAIVAEPVQRYETTPDVTFAASDDATRITATIYGSESFDAGHMHRDILHFEDWLGNELAEVVRAFWSAAISDVDGDGYLDQTVLFYSANSTAIQDDIYHGKELCLRGVTNYGTEFEACNFVE